jgi:hypothetical protein
MLYSCQFWGPFHGWGSYLLVFYHRDLDLFPGQSVWDLWWARSWDRFLSKYFDFPPSSIITPMLHTYHTSSTTNTI